MNASPSTLFCPACKVRYKVPAYKPGARYLCKKCRGPLSPPEELQEQATVIRSGAPASSPSAEPAPLFPAAVPQRFGDWEVLEEIGRGGMGIVLKARKPGEHRVVAIKTLLPGAAGDDLLHRFQREARASSKLRHPNIVAVHEVGTAGGLPYFVMDYVQGTPLDKRLKLKPVIPREAALLAREIAQALAYAHGHGVVHRDLKPANILIDPSGQPILMDFGLAKDTTSQSVLSMSGDVFGTPSYMPPEQASGKLSEVDARSDLYALGVILYEMLTGRLPFQGKNLSDTIYQVIHSEPPTPRSLKPRIPIDLEAVCLKAMEKEKARRYADAGKMIEDLDRFLKHEDVDAQRMTGLTQAGRTIRRNRVTLGTFAAGILACAVVGGGLWFALQKRGLDRVAADLADPLPSVRLKSLSLLVGDLEGHRLKPSEEARAYTLLAGADADADAEVALASLSACTRLAKDPQRIQALRDTPAFGPALARQFSHPKAEVAEAAVACAGWLEARGAYEALLPLLSSPQRSLRIAAVRSLGQLGIQQSIFPLMGLAQRDRPLTLEVINAIDKIYAKGHVQAALGRLMQKLPELLHATQDHDNEIEAAIAGDEPGKAAPETDPLKRGLARIRDPAAPAEERLQVAYELAKQGDRAIVPALLDCLTVDPEAVGLQAAWAAEELGGRDVVTFLLEKLEKGQPKERARAALALARPENPRISQALLLALAADPEPELAEALCRALGRTGDPAAADYLTRAAQRGDGRVKAAAQSALDALKPTR